MYMHNMKEFLLAIFPCHNLNAVTRILKGEQQSSNGQLFPSTIMDQPDGK
uniref:Transposase n=1 Tax=Ascaris lumbricoides TaxID=6252 RepID=A0A0M3I930_ASCLU